MSEVTGFVQTLQANHSEASDHLIPLVYKELRELAASRMAQQPPGQTLQATALVHEAWLKLAGNPAATWRNREHFFRTAAEAMRQILVDRARRRLSLRRGRNAEHVPLDLIEAVAPEKEEVLIQLDEALAELKTADPQQAEIVNLRFFVGLSELEVASIMNISERSVQRHWNYAKAWLFARIEDTRR